MAIKHKHIWVDIALFSLFMLIVLVGWFFYDTELFLYPIIGLIYLRIYFMIEGWYFNAKRLWLKPKQHLAPFLLGIALAIATYINLWVFGKFYNIPEWMKEYKAVHLLLASVLAQELIFRAYFISSFEKHLKPWPLIILSAIAFVMVHIYLPWISLFFILLLFSWVFWSWMFLKYRNIYANVFSHFLINLGTPFVLAMT